MLPLGAAAPPLSPPPAIIVASPCAYAAASTVLTPNAALSVNKAGSTTMLSSLSEESM
jgi:hypothetical protein